MLTANGKALLEGIMLTANGKALIECIMLTVNGQALIEGIMLTVNGKALIEGIMLTANGKALHNRHDPDPVPLTWCGWGMPGRQAGLRRLLSRQCSEPPWRPAQNG